VCVCENNTALRCEIRIISDLSLRHSYLSIISFRVVLN
jgi:hypothetical protein